MNVLIACEESQTVCIAFRRMGHEAYSCDIQDCSGGHPEWHIKADARELLKLKWDLIISHPPCTYLSRSGAMRLYNKDHTIKDLDRYMKGIDAARFFRIFWEADCEKVAIENPTPMKVFDLPPWTQTIEPYMFGEPWRKQTRLWLKGLPQLIPTKYVKPLGLWVGSSSTHHRSGVNERYFLSEKRDPKQRAKTFLGIAEAMANQWGGRTDKPTEIERKESEQEKAIRKKMICREQSEQISMF